MQDFLNLGALLQFTYVNAKWCNDSYPIDVDSKRFCNYPKGNSLDKLGG